MRFYMGKMLKVLAAVGGGNLKKVGYKNGFMVIGKSEVGGSGAWIIVGGGSAGEDEAHKSSGIELGSTGAGF